MAHELEEEELGGPSHTSAQAGLTLTVPSTSSPSQVTTQGAPTQDAPVAALRRYLDSIPQHPSPRREVVSSVVWRCVRGDVIASFLLTLVSTAAALQPPYHATLTGPCAQPRTGDVGVVGDGILSDSGWEGAVRWAVGHGAVMGALSWAVRGAHISPPTTLALLVTRKVSLLRAILHLSAQVLGALMAAPVLLGVLPRRPRPPQLGAHLSPVQGWGAEFLATLMVTLISLSAYEAAHAPSRYTKDAHWEATTPRFTPSAAVPVVAAHTAAALFCAEFTGIGLNPARSLAIAAVSGAWSYHWVYWVGPALGGLLAAFTHEYTGNKDPDALPTPYHPPLLPRDSSRPSDITSTLASPC
ncbi:lens fiber major intrinsic protein-like [Penaeus japonicus]|uniref:lens fiber major intrinsic protein-like n=1 Tax=Penaeus japonicus TaxID=27405 RepID=UPI001C70C374|nr:lens fiber major intrinsic protein-like [Penaeus japonicus]